MILLFIIIATILVSAVSLVGLALGGKHIHKILHFLIAFSAATLLSVALFDLLPESLHELKATLQISQIMLLVASGVVLFYLIESFIHWHHCGKEHDCKRKPAGQLVLIGDFVHNFFDGLVIAGSFLLNTASGITTTLTVFLHEIPQEIGDFSVLLHSGYSRFQALKLNFLSALSAIIGGIVGYFALGSATNAAPYAVAVTAGGFLYIALSDIMPEMHAHAKEQGLKWVETLIFVGTMIVFYFLLATLHTH